MIAHRPARAAAACTLALLAAAAPALALAAEEARNRDPFEKVNRATYAFNDALDRMLARPLARAYRNVVPEPARNVVSNFLTNLEYPTTLVNNLLQGKLGAAGTDTLRFVVNSTVGIGGLTDPATRFGIPSYDEDFGQTLGRWGLPSGPYLVLPVLGPSSLRDVPGRFADRYTNVRRYIGDGSTEYVLLGVDVLDTRAELLSLEGALQGAFDPYALVGDAYLQRRAFLATGGAVPADDYEIEEELPEEIPVDAPSESPGDAPDVAAGETPGAAPSQAPADATPPRSEVPPTESAPGASESVATPTPDGADG